MNNITQIFKKQFPEIYPSAFDKDKYSNYLVLHHFGTFCAKNFKDGKTKEILITVNDMYNQKSLFTNNAIENEFLSALATELGANDLMNQLNSFPQNLWQPYIKVLIQTQINKQQI